MIASKTLRSLPRAVLVVWGLGGGSILVAAGDATAPQLEWVGSSWARCDPSRLTEAYLRKDHPPCSPPDDSSRHILPDLPASQIAWDGGLMGSGMGCIVACTCVRDSHKDRVGICDFTVCPGDRIGRERYRFLAVVDEEAFVEAPKGRRNCWKAKLAPRRGKAH